MAINGQLTFPDVPGRISEHNQNPAAHSIRIDDTLSQSGMAADAKAVKDKIDEVTGEIDADIDALDGQVTDLKSAFDTAFPHRINLLPAKYQTIVVNGVTVTYEDGHFTVVGTANRNGGRLGRTIGPFTLPAGTYTIWQNGDYDFDWFVERAVDDYELAQFAYKRTFTLTDETEVYVGINVLNERSYDFECEVQLNTGEDARRYSNPSKREVFPSNYVTPEQYGAFGDGVNDDTVAIQAAVDSGLPVVFSPRTYIVSVDVDFGTAIGVTGNTTIYLNGATIKLATTSFTGYFVLRFFRGCNGASLFGPGNIIGDKDTNTSASGEWGHCISIDGNSENILIDGVTASKGWGDGIYVGYGTNVHINNCTCSQNRRNNITIIRTTNCFINDCYLYSPNGTNPQANFSVEANNTDDLIKNLIVDGCVCEATAGGSSMYISTRADGNSVTFRNCKMDKPLFTTVLEGDYNEFLIEGCEINCGSTYGTINCNHTPSHTYVTYDNCIFSGGAELLRHESGDLFNLCVKNSIVRNAIYTKIADWLLADAVSNNFIDVILDNVTFNSYGQSLFRGRKNSRLITNSVIPFTITESVPSLLYSECVFNPSTDGAIAVNFPDGSTLVPGQKYRILNTSVSNSFTAVFSYGFYDVTSKSSVSTVIVPAGHYIEIWNVNNNFYCEVV